MPSRQLIQTVVAELPAPAPPILDEAHLVELNVAEHHRLAAAIAAFGEIEQHPAEDMPPLPVLHVAAWNAERLKFHGPSVKLV